MRQRVAVFVFDGKNVLLLHRRKHGKEYYAVPGGGVEEGETEEYAAVRELREETSLDIVLGEKIGSLAANDASESFYVAESWVGTPKLGGPEAERNSPENFYELEWVPIERLGSLPFREEIRALLFSFVSRQ